MKIIRYLVATPDSTTRCKVPTPPSPSSETKGVDPIGNDEAITEKFKLAHTIDRLIYARLVGDIGFDYESAMGILAFWNWLESCGHSMVLANMLPLPDFMLCSLAKEAIKCIKFLQTGIPPLPYQSDDFQLLFSPGFIGGGFSFRFLRENVEREAALAMMDLIFEHVCKIVTSDIIVAPKVVVNGPELPSLLSPHQTTMWRLL